MKVATDGIFFPLDGILVTRGTTMRKHSLNWGKSVKMIQSQYLPFVILIILVAQLHEEEVPQWGHPRASSQPRHLQRQAPWRTNRRPRARGWGLKFSAINQMQMPPHQTPFRHFWKEKVPTPFFSINYHFSTFESWSPSCQKKCEKSITANNFFPQVVLLFVSFKFAALENLKFIQTNLLRKRKGFYLM